MRAKSMVLILIALGCGLIASIAISQVMERGSNKGTATLETVQIYVALSDIDVNEQLSATNVRLEDWPKSKIPEGAVVNFEEINERFARTRMYEGEPVLKRKLADNISGPAITIPEGDRVCSLKVRMDTAVSYLVKPGDRVDIFGYFREGRDIPKTGTREILRNVRVFAVNSETEQETDQEGRTIVAKTISVLVKQDQVARLMLAAELGTLRLALRRPNETAQRNPTETASIETLFGAAFRIGRRASDAEQSQIRSERFCEFSLGLAESSSGGGRRDLSGQHDIASAAAATPSRLADDAVDTKWWHPVHLARREGTARSGQYGGWRLRQPVASHRSCLVAGPGKMATSRISGSQRYGNKPPRTEAADG